MSPALAAPGVTVIPGSSGGTWGKAIVIPGLGRLNTGGSVEVSAVSCPAPGDCEAGGDYAVSDSNQQAFVVSQRNGSWNKAINIPGLGSLNAGKSASVDSLSCAAPGDCSAGGQYTTRNGQLQAFVVTERNGRWGRAIEVPGAARLDVTGGADIGAMSCARPGDCTAGGEYGVTGPSEGASEALVVTERNGRWARAIEVPGSAALNTGGTAAIDTVSCAAPGDCSAGGDYGSSRTGEQALVVTERNGRWAKAIEVPGSAALNTGRDARIESVSCAAPGHCSAGGIYSLGKAGLDSQGFVVTER